MRIWDHENRPLTKIDIELTDDEALQLRVAVDAILKGDAEHVHVPGEDPEHEVSVFRAGS